MSKLFNFKQLSITYKDSPFQTIQFSLQKQFHFKQFNLAWVRCLNVRTVLFRVFQFSIDTQFSCISPTESTLSCATTPGQSGPGSDGNEGVLYIPPKHQHYWKLTIWLFCVINRAFIWGGVLPLCRGAVSVFYSSRLLGNAQSQM